MWITVVHILQVLYLDRINDFLCNGVLPELVVGEEYERTKNESRVFSRIMA